MKKYLLLILTAFVFTATYATDFHKMLQDRIAQNPHINEVKAAMNQKSPQRIYGEWPEGDYRDYMLASYVVIYDEAIYTPDQVTQICFGTDGNIYFESFFPVFYHRLWIKGVQEGDIVTCDCETIVWSFDPDNTGEPYDYRVGELYLDEDTGMMGYRDAKFKREGDKFTYIPGDDLSELGLFEVWEGEIYPSTTTWDAVWTPVTDQEVTVPETAVKKDYVFYNEDLNKNKYARKGFVAVDGNDYYFNQLCSWEGVVKGTRSGNKITIPGNQYVGTDGSYFLYEGGFKTDFIYDGNGNLKGEASDIVLTIDANGKFQLEQPGSYMMVVLTPEGRIYDCSKRLSLEPYSGDVPLVPSDPYDLAITDRTGTYDNAYYFEYSMSNISADGKYLNPEKLGYYLYLDDEIYTFSKDVYKVDEDMTILPWGFADRQSYDIIWNGYGGVFWLYEYEFELLGLQMVYTVDDVTNYSNVVSVDLDNNVVVNFKTGIDHLNAQEPIKNPTWYDLNGRRVNGAKTHGVFIVDGKVMIK